MRAISVTLRERAALLLAIKEPGTAVALAHLVEKVGRDVQAADGYTPGAEAVRAAVAELVTAGLAEPQGDRYVPTGATDAFVEALAKTKATGLNRSYLLVWKATRYYAKAGALLLPFLAGRAVSTVKLFSGQRDPIREIAPIFVRYARYKPKPMPLTVASTDRLMSLVFDHCIDFVPYIHRLNAHEPDRFVLDLDAGSELLQHAKAFDYLKFVVAELRTLLLESDIVPMVKFSGSRGFQLWVQLENGAPRGGSDLFRSYRELAVSVQRRLEARLQRKRHEIRREYGDFVRADQALTTSQVAHKTARTHQILVDSSVLKPMGDVRAPFSIHYKTGLVSLPLAPEQLASFAPDEAEPLRLVATLQDYARASRIPVSSPGRLLALR